MARMGRSTRLKRQVAPAFWEIPRKEKRFVLSLIPGPHSSESSYPLGILLRDILKVVNNMREAHNVLVAGKVKVDGIVRRDEHFPVGLMDVIEIDALNKIYRLVPKDGIRLRPIDINEEEKGLKLCKITRKVTVKHNKIQYGLHDGKSLLDDTKANVQDTLLIDVAEQKVKNIIKLEKGVMALIIKGDNAGKLGIIEEIRDGTFILPKRVVMSIEGRRVELPVDMVIAVGIEKPMIKVN